MGRWTRVLAVAVAGAALAVALGAAACGGNDDGGITVYSGRSEDLIGPLLDRFEEETGIPAEVRYGDTAEMAATILEEGDGTPADVYIGQDAGALGALDKEGRLAPLPRGILELVDSPRFAAADGTWVATSGRVRVLGYDRRELRAADLPDSVFDLTDGRWRGEVGWAPANGSFQAFVTAMRLEHGDERTERWLRDMAANGAVAYDNNVLIRDAIASGEIRVGLLNHYYMERAKAELANPADYPVGTHIFPDGDVGSLINVAGAGVVAGSDAQEDAQQLVRFLLSPESQAYFAEQTREYPVAGGAAPPEDLPALAAIEQPRVDLNDLDDLRGTLQLIERAGIL